MGYSTEAPNGLDALVEHNSLLRSIGTEQCIDMTETQISALSMRDARGSESIYCIYNIVFVVCCTVCHPRRSP